jgi:RecJ-like exonuclease
MPQRECELCNGTGEGQTSESQCGWCGGWGFLRQDDTPRRDWDEDDEWPEYDLGGEA